MEKTGLLKILFFTTAQKCSKYTQKHRKLGLCAHPSAARTDRRLHRPSYEPRTVHVGIDLVGGPQNERPNPEHPQKPGFYAKLAILDRTTARGF